ncbi:MAG: SHOCT domain-containing protein, partial [Candidatus Woesearchaeota archaeon]|nr:SHOCT domain-containing protein [Candidatus Woesearchaeota archaeon]
SSYILKPMKKIITILLLSLTSSAYALPDCPSDVNARWHNCFGTFTYADGAKYVGEFEDDKKHGQGTFTLANGDKYIGGWKDDKRHGQGTLTLADGEKYVGGWKDDKRHGQGTYTYASGNKYIGGWKDGKGHGQGTYTWADGDKYIGGWKDGKSHGQGTLTLANGTTKTGIWEDGEYIGTGAEPNTNGSSATENNLPVLSVLFVLIFVFLVLLYITVTKRRAGAHGTESREQPTEKLRAWTSLISILLMVGLPLGTLGITGYNTMTLPRENPSLLDLAGWNLYSNLEWVAMGIFSLISIYVGWSIRTQRDASATHRNSETPATWYASAKRAQRDASATHRNILFIWGLCVAAPLTMDSVIPALALGLPLHELIFDPGNLGHLFGLAIFAAFCQRYLSRSMNLASGHQRAVGISSEGGAAWELEKFAELKEKGIISEEEFNKKKEQLLK